MVMVGGGVGVRGSGGEEHIKSMRVLTGTEVQNVHICVCEGEYAFGNSDH